MIAELKKIREQIAELREKKAILIVSVTLNDGTIVKYELLGEVEGMGTLARRQGGRIDILSEKNWALIRVDDIADAWPQRVSMAEVPRALTPKEN